MATSTISNTILGPTGMAVEGVSVQVRLMPSGGFREDTFTEVARLVTTTTDSNGLWSLALERNSNISPENTWYEVTELIPDESGGRRVWNITVGDSNQTVYAALTSDLGSASSGTYLTQDSADARYQALGSLGGAPNTMEPDDTASAGVSTSASRADHEHGIVTAAAGAIQPDDAAAEGVATSFSRSDHKHSIVAAAPTTVDLDGTGSASEGVAISFSRSDHKHAAENDAWTAYTPTNSGITVGNGTQTATYARVGRTIHVHYLLTFGSTTAVTGNVEIGLPVAAAAGERSFGVVSMLDSGTRWFVGSGRAGGTTARVGINHTESGNAGQVNATNPFTWTTSDHLAAQFTYEAA